MWSQMNRSQKNVVSNDCGLKWSSLKWIGLNSMSSLMTWSQTSVVSIMGPFIGLFLSGKLLSFDEVCLFHRNYTKENIWSSIVNYNIFSYHLPGLVTKNGYGEIILQYWLLKTLFLWTIRWLLILRLVTTCHLQTLFLNFNYW